MERKEKIVIQSRLGEQVVDKSKIIYFPKGLIGFEDQHQFVLLQIRKGAPLLLLQSIENPQLGLLVADPYVFLPNYTIKVGDAEQRMLCLETATDASVLVTVSIPHGKPNLTSLNLTGPILVHSHRMIGLQVPQSEANPSHVLLESLVQGPMPQLASSPISLSSHQEAFTEKGPNTEDCQIADKILPVENTTHTLENSEKPLQSNSDNLVQPENLNQDQSPKPKRKLSIKKSKIL